MARFGRLATGALALAAAAITVASGPVSAREKQDGSREKREIRIVHRGEGGYLGVQLEDVGEDDVSRLKLAEERGALVSEVVEEGPAAKAGLKEGDVILRFQGETVHSAAQLARLVAETPAGRTVSLEVSREGDVQRLSVSLGERKNRSWKSLMPDFDFDLPTPPEAPTAPTAPIVPEPPLVPESRGGRLHELLGEGWGEGFHLLGGGPRKLGIGYQEISGQLARYFKLPGESGVLVTHVDEDGPAAKAGVKAGDVILEFAGKTVDDGEEFRDAVREAEFGQEVSLKVQRDGQPLDVRVALADREREGRRRTGVRI